MNKAVFKLHSDYGTAGDQQQAIDSLVKNFSEGNRYQILKGVTGSGKTFTMANVIKEIGRPTLVLSHNKTLAAQLFREFKSFFPENAVEYFVSNYDYYQPEAYVPGKDLYIEKEADINDEIDRLRMAASFSLLERRDVIVVATVSCIYGLGNPTSLQDMLQTFTVGDSFDQKAVLKKLVSMQYERNDLILTRGTFRSKGETLEIYPAYLEHAIRVSVDWDNISEIKWFDPLTNKTIESVPSVKLYPAKQFVMPQNQVRDALGRIRSELDDQISYFQQNNKPVEAERIKTRVEYDMEMLAEIGHCPGIENYSRLLGNRKKGERPAVLLDYFPVDFITFIDESHVTLPQLGAMYEGDRARKENLVNYGFRLPSALDNRPLKYAEFIENTNEIFFVSATPGETEKKLSNNLITEQIIRPTGLLDPEIVVRPTEGQMEDLYGEIREVVKNHGRVLITTLTKRMAEDLTNYLSNLDLKVRYLHSEIETIERVEILRDLRLGKFDVLVGINLLREGLDLPEVSLVAILDADKIGFLRSATSLIQTIGRAARNVDGRVIMYADRTSDAMAEAIGETNRRRELQTRYNTEHNITPTSIKKSVSDILERQIQDEHSDEQADLKIRASRFNLLEKKDRKAYIKELEKEMIEAAKDLAFERAAALRDEIERIKNL